MSLGLNHQNQQIMKYFIILLLALSLTGCVKIITGDLEAKDPKLVLNSAISTDSAITVNLSRTFNIFDDESDKNLPFIDGAQVSFFENGNHLFDLENLGYGYYAKPGFYPETGKEYSVEASYSGFTSIESKTCRTFTNLPAHGKGLVVETGPFLDGYTVQGGVPDDL